MLFYQQQNASHRHISYKLSLQQITNIRKNILPAHEYFCNMLLQQNKIYINQWKIDTIRWTLLFDDLSSQNWILKKILSKKSSHH